ncbi:MAG: AbrB/MazE/SpoVT family DNA-binding domain-containing protein [Acidobacteriota bacterium]|nr:AbrB/MazE/SpoVT family DNA-binding domain-containing protein [Acidobacteriota bacterium]
MTTQLAKWGNSLALRLPKAVAQEARLHPGDEVEISVSKGTVVIAPAQPKYALDDLVAAITPANRHDEADWGAPAGREAW